MGTDGRDEPGADQAQQVEPFVPSTAVGGMTSEEFAKAIIEAGTRLRDSMSRMATLLQPLCPEAKRRSDMGDAEFWDHVFYNDERGRYDPWTPPEPDELAVMHISSPCPVCGELAGCGYDALGRPMIHVTDPEEDDEGLDVFQERVQ